MKHCAKIISAVLLIILALSFSAYAAPSDDMFNRAKQATALISYGEYASALQELDLFDGDYSEQLEKYIKDNCKSILTSSVQSDVSVGWAEGDYWVIAVPFSKPDDDAVGCFIFKIENEDTFDTLRFTRWGKVKSAYENSTEIKWKDEYTPDTVAVFADIEEWDPNEAFDNNWAGGE